MKSNENKRRGLALLDAEVRDHVDRAEPVTYHLNTPWSTLDLLPYRARCLADENQSVVSAIAQSLRTWDAESLSLIQQHAGEDVFCLECPSAVLRAATHVILPTRTTATVGFAAHGDGGVVKLDAQGLKIEMRFLEALQVLISTQGRAASLHRVFSIALLDRNGYTLGECEIGSNDSTTFKLPRDRSLADVRFVKVQVSSESD